MKFRKMPVIVEAVQLRWTNWDEVLALLGEAFLVENASGAEAIGVEEVSDTCGEPGPNYIKLNVRTAHGEIAVVRHGDWIIPEKTPGRFYPCKPDVFAETYEPAGVTSLAAMILRVIAKGQSVCSKMTPGNWKVGLFRTDDLEDQVAEFRETMTENAGSPMKMIYVANGKNPSPLDDSALAVMVVGNGPTSQANANGIAWLGTHWKTLLVLALEAVEHRERLIVDGTVHECHHREVCDALGIPVTDVRLRDSLSWETLLHQITTNRTSGSDWQLVAERHANEVAELRRQNEELVAEVERKTQLLMSTRLRLRDDQG